MTAPQRMIVRSTVDAWGKSNNASRKLYGGSLVQLASDHRDANKARSWLILKGPYPGEQRWFTDDQLEPEPPYADPGIETKGDA